jgi:hypothetical protein
MQAILDVDRLNWLSGMPLLVWLLHIVYRQTTQVLARYCCRFHSSSHTSIWRMEIHLILTFQSWVIRFQILLKILDFLQILLIALLEIVSFFVEKFQFHLKLLMNLLSDFRNNVIHVFLLFLSHFLFKFLDVFGFFRLIFCTF